ncbi:tripartite tricarboxylate transporter substrate binding protein [Bordetella sp. BOR01]|uniref:Bug family tripartite tricarboxylate transporter substrate binding protein n=1 Tax=Bordetella sp. BOR01 TaxID=2854779 RepID=UPI001C4636AD|nr:tripartite tricarboxylate transporter substrate binding protein [Bordetella sp. BOR01]MBV7483260.1 tripartite tricarboxylate transporter substrate binding protein [Bordetella sp. BOR01]
MHRISRRSLILAGTAAVIGSAAPKLGRAQPYKPAGHPSMICAYPAGALGDGTARIVAKGLSQAWGMTVPVENKTGAAGMIAAGQVAKGAADGATLLCMIPEALSVAKALQVPVGFDVLADLKPIAIPVVSACILAVNGKSRFQTYAELVDFAKQHPGEISFGIQGTGSAFHLALERWATAAGIKVTPVPYRGGAAVLTDLLGGQIDAMFLATSLGLPYFQDGRLRPLAATSKDRISALPELRTLEELGVAGYDLSVSIGILAQGNTGPAVADALNKACLQAMMTPEAQAWMKQNYVTTSDLSPGQLQERMIKEVAEFTEIAKRANIRLS